MKVLLFDIQAKNDKGCVNKDLAGGMGTRTWVGNSLRARIFEYVKKRNVILPDITLAYLIAIFKKAGWEVELVEVKDDNLKISQADLALVHTSIVDCQNELEIVKKIRQKGVKVGVYGTFASAVPEYFSKDADFVIKGEAESGILKILEDKKIPEGIFEAELIRNIDKLPFPDWNFFNINKFYYSPALNKKPVLTMLTSRGCPYTCRYYCPYTIMAGRMWRTRSVDNIMEEILYLKKEYKIKAIDFRDAIFTLDKERIYKLCEKIKKEKIKITWSCETRLDCLDKDLIKAMKSAGLKNFNIGIESSSEEILKKSRRLPIKINHQEEIIEYCHKNGISIAAFYILGLEDDTTESINSTINYSQKLNTLVAQFSISTPYPNTEFYSKLSKEQRIIESNWQRYDSYTPVYRHNNIDKKDLLNLKEKAFVSYYFRLPYILKHMPKYVFEKFLWPY
ncbi:MAG: radical SAM protein [Patescibacteria group bacterium]